MKRRQFIIHTGIIVALASRAKASFLNRTMAITPHVHIEQFKDTGLAHFSYAIISNGEIVLVDPARNPQIYYDFAASKGAKITRIIETHPHADFISSHLEIHKKEKAIIYVSKLVKAQYPHQAFDEGDVIRLTDKIALKAIHTPGHSPDSISIILQEDGKDRAVFSGDALLFGDVGRPDLRSYSGEFETEKKNLAKQMYHTIKNKFAPLADDVIVYPAHGAGSLCGNTIRDVNQSTIGYEKANNHAFKNIPEEEFVQSLLKDQPHIPFYFPFDVEQNKIGFAGFTESINKVALSGKNISPAKDAVIVDTRNADLYQRSHLQNSINIPDGGKFETWLGSIIKPEQKFYLVAESQDKLIPLISKTAKIGYEGLIKGAFAYDLLNGISSDKFENNLFSGNENEFTIIDVRTNKEASANKIFKNSVNIPLTELTERLEDIPKDKPVIVHCASGYRSAIGASLLKNHLPQLKILDLSSNITKFQAQQESCDN